MYNRDEIELHSAQSEKYVPISSGTVLANIEEGHVPRWTLIYDGHHDSSGVNVVLIISRTESALNFRDRVGIRIGAVALR